MHSYSTDDSSHARILIWLALASIGLNEGAWYFLEMAGIDDLPVWLDGPSVLAFFGILFAAIDQWGWRQRFVRTLFLINTPDLNGDWTGTGKTSFDEHAGPFECSAAIQQTWTRIGIRMTTASSRSYSRSASVFSDKVLPQVTYTYVNEPESGSSSTMHTHRGTAALEFSATGSGVLAGTYFTGRDRQTFGTLELSRTSKT